MTFSTRLVQAVLEPNTAEVFLFLLTFDHPNFENPIRLVNDLDNITSRGNIYTAFPLKLELPPDDADSLPTVQITVENASLDLVDELRSIQSPMSMTLEVILASTPDTIETSIENMRVAQVQYDKQTIQMTCTVDDLLNTAFPKEKYLPSNFPGLFR
jgi:hypothetical protein